MKYAIVLAAGKGTRMKSSQNKVMQPLLHKPMIGHVVDQLEAVGVDETVVVTGYQKESIEQYLKDRVQYAYQDEQTGTGNAVSAVHQLKDKKGSTLLLLGDCAIVQKESLEYIFENHNGYDLTILSATVKNPKHYNRVLRDHQGEVDRVVDIRDASDVETSINEINLGVYVFNNELLYKYLPEISANFKDHLSVTDLVEIMKRNGHKIQALKVDDPFEFMGINDREQLALSNNWLRNKTNHKHMENGVTLVDPYATYIGSDVVIEEDVTIYPNVHIYGQSTIKSGSTILSGSWLENAKVGHNSTVDNSKIINSEIGDSVSIGPFAHLRMNTVVGDNVRIGNFVEFKNTNFGRKSNCAHLTYIGDSDVGEYVNIGCGVVTVNYDGKNKYRTVIDDGAFVGSNVNLIAPIKVGKNAVVAAGSTVNEDVEDGEMAIARTRQTNKPGYGEIYTSKRVKK
ncbi:bifunctional N-acetylglucosamine-1-phosphate uridyltransferase/glucosamine-1-phosphate acetyltransferase [Erysipelothrix larvae]|uniref:Bifunctional protein GlmU n=1 Tax=Erysipelothrix larvae TaxID=1514105 RepID=A0A0X8GXX9_9FIRM|nr:bifunctional UDP-N-acetylglucosamine diphosphorylase/glucosamine-1-phosphate N-acetyltransferase GlmU [Erysipelothrix larvae]AMC92468.1 bifunctional N-acetylglucosamine-1-phosphate uridyltransferase/glucosamine-1-phosphate acetyltransferase [Erysipelothrix larvae]